MVMGIGEHFSYYRLVDNTVNFFMSIDYSNK